MRLDHSLRYFLILALSVFSDTSSESTNKYLNQEGQRNEILDESKNETTTIEITDTSTITDVKPTPLSEKYEQENKTKTKIKDLTDSSTVTDTPPTILSEQDNEIETTTIITDTTDFSTITDTTTLTSRGKNRHEKKTETTTTETTDSSKVTNTPPSEEHVQENKIVRTTTTDKTDTSTFTVTPLPLREKDRHENMTERTTTEAIDSSTIIATPPLSSHNKDTLSLTLQIDKTENKKVIISAETSNMQENVTVDNAKSNISEGLDSSRPVQVLIGQNGSIAVADISIRKRVPNIIEDPQVNFYSIDFLHSKNLIFYTAKNSIVRATLDSEYTEHTYIHTISNPKVIVNTEVDGHVRLAVDWIHEKLYWMADKDQTVTMADLDGSNRRRLFEDVTMNFIFPNNIVLDPYEKLVFFVNNHVVYKSDLNGSNPELFIIPENYEGEEYRGVRTIALDRVSKQLYYSGRDQDGSEIRHYLEQINYIDVNYDDIKELNMSGLNDIYSMDVLGGTLYFAHFKGYGYKETSSCSDLLMSVNKNFSGTDTPVVRFAPRRCRDGIWSIKVFHPCAQTLDCDDVV